MLCSNTELNRVFYVNLFLLKENLFRLKYLHSFCQHLEIKPHLKSLVPQLLL